MSIRNDWDLQVEMIEQDNRLRQMTDRERRTEAEHKLAELENRAAWSEPVPAECEDM